MSSYCVSSSPVNINLVCCGVSCNFFVEKMAKRENVIDWREYFMAVAFLSGQRSKDPVTQVGACIVNAENRIVGVGYNGMPDGCAGIKCNDDSFPWDKHTKDPLDSKHMYVCHAELNAIVNKYSANLRDTTMYVGLHPCNECAKLIVQSGIKKIFYMSDKHGDKPAFMGAKRIFEFAKVECKPFVPKEKHILIDFGAIDEKKSSGK